MELDELFQGADVEGVVWLLPSLCRSGKGALSGPFRDHFNMSSGEEGTTQLAHPHLLKLENQSPAEKFFPKVLWSDPATSLIVYLYTIIHVYLPKRPLLSLTSTNPNRLWKRVREYKGIRLACMVYVIEVLK